MQSKMRLHDFDECVRDAARLIDMGHTIFQQFNCAHCGIKQTMEAPNLFFRSGKCEECGRITNIEKNGCNYMVVMGRDK